MDKLFRIKLNDRMLLILKISDHYHIMDHV